MKRLLVKAGLVLTSALALQLPAQAQAIPEISPSLKKMLGALPLADMKDEVQGMVKALKKMQCADLNGCYSTKSGPLQLYFFTSSTAQQTFLLVINKKLALPKLLKENVQKILGGTSLSDPIISISTTDFELDTAKMPADLQKIVRDSYFNVNTLAFSGGVQLAGRADLGGFMKLTMKEMGVDSDKLTLRAGVVMPIPTDLTSAAGAGAGLADAMAHSKTMQKSGAKSAAPEAFVEFQLAPGATISMPGPTMFMTDTTFFINNMGVFGYKGNARFNGTQKDILLQFQTPLDPMDLQNPINLLDFSFRMAMPQSFTLSDMANMILAMAMPDTGMLGAKATQSLNDLGGGFVGKINSFKKPLFAATKPLSVFQLRNPNPPAPYKFGDRTKPFPTTDAPFNVILLGPLTDGGPLMYVASDVQILGQPMGKMEVSAGKKGFHGMAEASIVLKLGPLGKTSVKMKALADITGNEQDISLKGDLMGQKLAIVLSGEKLTIDLSASCVNPFEIKVQVEIEETMNIAKIFEGQAGANVDPSTISGCLGKELEAAYKKIANEYKNTTGYAASEANRALEGLRSFDTSIVKTWTSLGVDGAGDDVSGELKKLGNQVGKASCRLSGNCKKKKKVSQVCLAVLDEEFYIRKYTIIKSADAVWHWAESSTCKNGSLQGSAEFYAPYYFEQNQARYNFNSRDREQYESITKHWLDYGRKDGVRGSADFNIAEYSEQNPGLLAGFNGHWDELWNHWLTSGINEGRPISREFRATEYLELYPDLRQLLGEKNYPAAFDHWVITGKAEGRKGRLP